MFNTLSVLQSLNEILSLNENTAFSKHFHVIIHIYQSYSGSFKRATMFSYKFVLFLANSLKVLIFLLTHKRQKPNDFTEVLYSLYITKT